MYTCFICRNEITQKDVDDGKALLLRIAEGDRKYVCTRHPGMEEEYARQVAEMK